VSEELALYTVGGQIRERINRIPLRRLPGNRVTSAEMDLEVNSFSEISEKQRLAERIALAFAAQLHVPRDQVDLITHAGPMIPRHVFRFQVLAHLTDNRIHTEHQAMQHYLHPPESPKAPEYIDI
jgi:hypothetical protein